MTAQNFRIDELRAEKCEALQGRVGHFCFAYWSVTGQKHWEVFEEGFHFRRNDWKYLPGKGANGVLKSPPPASPPQRSQWAFPKTHCYPRMSESSPCKQQPEAGMPHAHPPGETGERGRQVLNQFLTASVFYFGLP